MMSHNSHKHILIIAFHYPPILSSSGVHRTTNFVRHLPEFGWQPTVLTINPRVYDVVDTTFAGDFPNIEVKRAFAFNTAKHLSYKGRYFKLLALPDRWISWIFWAIPAGLKFIRRYKPRYIYSTYPIATAHLIAYWLHRMTGLPWIADFRDPMTDKAYPTDKQIKRIYSWIEKRSIAACQYAIFTTPDTLRMYKERYPNISAEKYFVIPNGFNEEIFQTIELNLGKATAHKPGDPYRLIHSGILYPSERNPEPFFCAISELKQEGKLTAADIKIILRASTNEEAYQRRLNELAINDIVSLEANLPYNMALGEMIQADGLLLFQAANCNHQIPGKAYEYLRAKTPVFALTDRRGNTAQLLLDNGIDTIVDIADKDDIRDGLVKFLDQLKSGTAPIASDSNIQRYSRRHGAQELATILDRILTPAP